MEFGVDGEFYYGLSSGAFCFYFTRDMMTESLSEDIELYSIIFQIEYRLSTFLHYIPYYRHSNLINKSFWKALISSSNNEILNRYLTILYLTYNIPPLLLQAVPFFNLEGHLVIDFNLLALIETYLKHFCENQIWRIW